MPVHLSVDVVRKGILEAARGPRGGVVGKGHLLRDRRNRCQSETGRAVGRLLKARMKAAGLSRQEVVARLGYHNVTRGLRRLDALLSEGKGRLSDQAFERLARELDIAAEVAEIQATARDETAQIDAQLRAEADLLRANVERLTREAPRIAADEALRMSLVSESALVSMAYFGEHLLPLGTLVEFWSRQAETTGMYVLGVGGSILSGSGSVWGISTSDCGSCGRRFDRDLAFDLFTHPLVAPFQRRLAEGRFLRIAQILEGLDG